MLCKVLLLAVLVHEAWSIEHGAWSMEHGAWGIPRHFSRYMLHAIQAENSQEREEILTEEQEENEKKLANLVVIHTMSDKNKWNRVVKRDQKYKTKKK